MQEYVPKKVKVRRGSLEDITFAESRREELNDLLLDGTFEPKRETLIPGNPRVFGSHFVEELKKVGDILKKKSRIVAQNYGDEGETSIATKAPTVERFSQRLAHCLAESTTDLQTYPST